METALRPCSLLVPSCFPSIPAHDTRLIQSSIPVRRSAAQPYSTRSPAQPYQPSQPYQPPQPYPARQSTQHLPHSNNRPLHQPTPAPKGTPAPSGGSNNTCHVCKGIGHWAKDCPSRRVDSLGSRPTGPKVMVVTKDSFNEATDSGDSHSGNTEPEQEDMDLRPYQQHMDSDHEDEQDDDDDKGNVRKAVLELSGMVQDHPARILADTGAGLSIVSDSFISKYQIPTKPTKTRSIHGVTGHQLSINSSASMQVSIGTHNLGVVEASVADTADYDLILGFTELRKLKPTVMGGMRRS
ncbi:uncharacterized protein UDID_18094 [Ustilago sp. UG-2017a]|nr:uncharacterized protein UDID_18094 [Ustilago sp. UG-2017a]